MVGVAVGGDGASRSESTPNPTLHPWSGMRWIADMAYPTSGDSDFLDVLTPWWRDALADFRDVLVASRKRVR